MKKRFIALLLLIPIALGAVFIPTSGVFGGLEDDKAATEQKIEAFRQEIAAKEGEVDAILAQVDTVNNQIATIEGQIAELDAQKAVIEETIVAKQANVDAAKAQFDSMKGTVYNRARQMYETGEINVLQIFMESEDLTQVGNANEYYRLIKAEDTKQVEAVKQERLNLETQKKALEEEKVVLEDNRKEVAAKEVDLDVEKQKLEAAQSVVESAIAKKTEQLNSEEAALASINAEIDAATARYAAEIAKLEAEAAAAAQQPSGGDSGSSGTGSGTSDGGSSGGSGIVSGSGFTWPVPSSSYITSYYEYRWGAMHRGIDIGASKGAAVVAADRGVVLAAGYTGDGFGNKVVIRHANGIITLYGHMDFVSVSAGQTVERGQYLGGVGNTGNSFGDHLHFQVSTTGNMYDGVDPMSYF